MGEKAMGEDEALILQGQADMWKYSLSIVDSMVLKSVVELGIPDIIHRHGGPITLSQIAASLSDTTSLDPTILSRIMRHLVRRNIFTASGGEGGDDTLYGLTHSSRWLLRDSDISLAPIILMGHHPAFLASWNYFSQGLKESGLAFKKANNGLDLFEFLSQNAEINKIFNDGMACTARITLKTIISTYKEGFERIGSLVDVGGNTGGTVAEIVKAYPHIKCINFDLPHVVANAPQYDRVTHVAGDMFHSVPNADAVFIKWILHDWSDEDCIKILRNCKRAIAEDKGKVIIVEFVLKPEGKGLFDDTGFYFDLLMIAQTHGRERTESEWKKLLNKAGFPRYQVINIPSFLSIIEAYPA